MRFFMAGLKLLGHVTRWLTGPDLTTSTMMQSIFSRLPVDELKQKAISRGRARSIQEWEQLSAKAMAGINPDSHWTFHHDTWGPHEVIVMPRIIDSNTGVVTGPPGNPDRGAVVTNDGQMPNCDPPALNSILYGDKVPND